VACFLPPAKNPARTRRPIDAVENPSQPAERDLATCFFAKTDNLPFNFAPGAAKYF
jgi:hypothetical protein